MTTRILLLSVSAGAGHVRAAQALEHTAAETLHDVEVAHVDVMDLVPKLFRKAYTQSYVRIVQEHPALWGFLYGKTDREEGEDSRTRRLRLAIERLNTRKLERAIVSHAPDHIICTHFLPAELLSRLIDNGRLPAPVWVQVTDFDVHHLWIRPHMAGYFAASEEVAWRMRDRGVPAERVHVTGIPVMPVFRELPSREVCAREIGIDPGETTLLMMAGGLGIGDLPELAWAAGSFTDNLEGVRAVVATMTQPHRSDGLQVVGRVLVAHLSMAAGQWAAASSQLDRAAALDPTTALEHRTLLATLPFHRRPAEELSDLRMRFADLPPPGPAASPLVWHTVHDGLHEVLRAYLVGLVSAALGERDAVARQVAFLERQSGSPDTVPALGDLALGVRAAAALADGDAERAAALLDALRLQTWHQLNVASPFYSLGRERFLRARAYQQVGRLDDAERWYDSFTNTSVHDLVYLAPSHFYRGEIAEARGALEEAVAHYQRVLELWSDADAALQPLVEEARARIAHLVPHP